MGTGSLRDGSGVQGRSLGGVWERSSQKPDVYKQFAAVKCFTTQVCCRVCSPSLSTPKKLYSSDLHESHDPARPRQGGHVPTRGLRAYATVLIILSLIYEQISETTVCQVYHLSFDNIAKWELGLLLPQRSLNCRWAWQSCIALSESISNDWIIQQTANCSRFGGQVSRTTKRRIVFAVCTHNVVTR